MRPSRIALAGALALVSLCGTAIVVSAQQQDARPVRTWSFSEVREQLRRVAGLSPRGEPTFDAPPATVQVPAVCPSGPAPDAGTLQFSRSIYGAPFVEVTRTGASTGAVSASVITSDGSALAGADYTAVSTTVRFEDGDTSPRLVEIPIVQDVVPENAESFDVSLLDPNCVTFGARTTAEVTIGGGDFALARRRPASTPR
jgi:hypothetical protein